MKFEGVYEGMAESIKKGYGAGTVFGEPMEVGQGITIVPVAKVKMAGGGGGGEEQSKKEGEGDESKMGKARGKGSGFGFKGGVKPVGYIMIKGDKARWVGIPDMHKMKKCLIPLGMCALIILKRKMLHMKFKKMEYMRHGMAPFGPKMMHKPPWAYGGHHHHHEHHMEHPHAPYGYPHMGTMKPPDWRALKRKWMAEKKAQGESAQA